MRTDDINELLRVLGSSEGCLPLDQLLAAIKGRQGSEVQANAERHVAECPSCETELALFREFESPAIRSEERADVEAIVENLRKHSAVPAAAPWWQSLWRFKIIAPASLAAAAILAIVVFVPKATEPRLGSFRADDTLRSSRLRALSPIGSVTAIPDFFKWSPVKEAYKYRVRLFEVDNTQLWEAELQTVSVRIPDQIQRQIIPLKKLNWQVTAFDPAGAAMADSGTENFTLQKSTAP